MESTKGRIKGSVVILEVDVEIRKIKECVYVWYEQLSECVIRLNRRRAVSVCRVGCERLRNIRKSV